MKEDVLEQLVEDWFISRTGYFVKHNLRYRPSKDHREYISRKDSVHSDIDILAINNLNKGLDRVAAVTCKSWQGGFSFSEWFPAFESEAEYNKKSADFKKRERWKYFREIISDKWIEAFLDKIKSETGQIDFEYIIAVTKFNGTTEEKAKIENSDVVLNRFKEKGSTIRIKILTLEELIAEYQNRLQQNQSTTLEATEIGRLMQIIHAANFEIRKN
ncbi:MAG: hypothetical protein J7L86_06780 [Candidatus Marinimicrobia bacterium]|nr:hypothetical protein [Candidatus Neomarinimicrobiota bacterium]